MFSFVLTAGFSAKAASSVAKLEKQLVQQKQKAQERRNSLKRLTEQEKKLNADLARSESRIDELESNLAKLQEQIGELAQSDSEAEAEYNTLRAEQDKTLAAQTELLGLLWEILCKRESIGSRDMLDWAATDREYRWSKDLLVVLGTYHAELLEQQRKLDSVLTKRNKFAREISAKVEKATAEKEKLLKSRLEYNQKLARVRNERDDTENELTEILRLVESLDFQIEEAGGAIERQKGKLPWPVDGTIKLKYAPGASPARRGLGFSASDGKAVTAIAAGKVVHNDVLRGFGTVLIMQHGDEYYSLYAFLGSSPLKVGQSIAKQQKIGTVGFYPDIHGPGLYFELRFKQKAINPEQWLSRR